MMNKQKNQIVVAMDFSESAENALKMACEFSKIHDAEIVLLTVVESSGGWLSRGNGKKESREDLEAKMNEILEKCRSEGKNVRPIIKEGSPSKLILDTANELKAEMIVMGTHGWPRKVDGKMLGTIGSKVIRAANCPVVTVKDLKDEQKVKKILIPVSPKFGIREIRKMLEDFEGKYEDKIELISVLSTELTKEDKEYQSWAGYLRKQHKALSSMGFTNIEVMMISNDDVSKAISQYAESHDNEIDLIMMETHGRTGIDRMFSGSVTEAVINHTHLPVLSIRPDREESSSRSFGPSGY